MAKKEYRTEKSKNKYSSLQKEAKKEIQEVKKPLIKQKEYDFKENKEIFCMAPVS